MKKKIINKIYEDTSWDFRTEDTKTTSQGIHNYPAMMIPQIARRLIELYAPKKGGILLDPFCGSGSSLVEARLQGLNSYGVDINPLARLIAKVKSALIEPELLDEYIKKVKSEVINAEFNNGFNLSKIEIPKFNGLEFWFKKDVIKRLQLIKSIILKISNNSPDIKDFLLVTFSHTLRDCSNTRNGEFKLYRMPEEKLLNYSPDVYKRFIGKLEYNYEAIKNFYTECKKIKNYNALWVKILDEDTRRKISIPDESVDIILTSPPYGDSRTTVAYGQYTKLSSEWLGLNNNKKDIDKISLGGQIVNSLENQLGSESLNISLKHIAEQDEKRAREVLSFYIDLDKCLAEIKRVMKPKGYICMVVGNRTVKGIQIPTDKVLVEISNKHGILHKETVIRNIPNKRMPSKNSPTNVKGKLSSTMVKEYIVILMNQ
ncbi:MAG TPA: DNA methyltransferase [Elusimicrobia bacterium]|nr:DNA methyltransferase [Elusimicrobiota bacterium]